MDWIRTLFIIITAGIFFSTAVVGQSFETGLNLPLGLAHSSGFEPGTNGFGLEVSYLHKMPKEITAHGGLELGITGWGSQVLLPLGVRFGNRHQLDIELLNGLALYRQGSQYVTGAGAYYVYTLFRNRKHRLVISAGLRFTIQPSYREYSDLYAYLDLPIRLRWQFGKSDKQSK
jgi:hypothetical protein